MTADTFKAQLRSQGKTIDQWAKENNFTPSAVYRVLNGVYKGNFGVSHDIAVAAGIKKVDAVPAGIDRRTTQERRAA